MSLLGECYLDSNPAFSIVCHAFPVAKGFLDVRYYFYLSSFACRWVGEVANVGVAGTVGVGGTVAEWSIGLVLSSFCWG